MLEDCVWSSRQVQPLLGAVAGVIIGAVGSLPLIAQIVVYLAQLFSGA